jgi:hypothetical protein
MTVEGAYILPKGDNVVFRLAFWCIHKGEWMYATYIGKYNAHISEMQFLCIAKRVSKSQRERERERERE